MQRLGCTERASRLVVLEEVVGLVAVGEDLGRPRNLRIGPSLAAHYRSRGPVSF